jgi:hypothetical protein
MAKKKNISNSKKAINILSKKGNGFGISTFKISTLSVFQELSCYDEIIINSLVAIIVIVNMIQIRAMRPTSSAQEVDTSDSFKLYKSRIIRNDPGTILKSSLAAAAAFAFLGETPEAVEKQLNSIINSGGQNGKLITTPITKNNYALWIYGSISQIGGFMNSCPATNPSIFGLNQPLALTVQNIIDSIDLPGKPSYDEVILRTRNYIITNPMDGQVSESFNFKEVLDGLKPTTPLEDEILGKSFIIREDDSRLRIGASGSIPKNAPTPEDLVKYLSTFDRTRYAQAGIVGARDVLISLNRKVMDLMKAEREAADTENFTVDEESEDATSVEEQPVTEPETTKQSSALGSDKRNVRRRNQSKLSDD